MHRPKYAAAAVLVLTAASIWITAVLLLPLRVDPDARLDRITTAHPSVKVPGIVRLDVRAFYDARDFAPAWVKDGALAPAWKNDGALSPNVTAALDVLDLAASHGLNANDYPAAELRAVHAALASAPADTRDSSDYTEALLDFDVRLTTALLALGHDVAVGRTPPADFDPLWRSRREPPNLARTLAHAIDTNLALWLDDIAPRHAEYRALKAALADPERLAATGRDDAASVIAANMERWRWVPDDFGDRNVIVNIPAFTLVARRPGADDFTMRVVVGKPKTNETPILSSEISSVVFSPSWNIPASIAAKETVPAQLRDPGYLAKHGIEALRPTSQGFVRVDPADLRMTNPSELKRMVYRQKPGPDNALGQVKFPFPNEHSVYLHDTPSDGAFGRVMRAVSHGCVRLEQPEKLAAFALGIDAGESDWTPARIARAMNSGREQYVKLPAPVRVHLVYFTVSVDEHGALIFLPDIYKLDARAPRILPPSFDTISNSAFVTG